MLRIKCVVNREISIRVWSVAVVANGLDYAVFFWRFCVNVLFILALNIMWLFLASLVGSCLSLVRIKQSLRVGRFLGKNEILIKMCGFG